MTVSWVAACHAAIDAAAAGQDPVAAVSDVPDDEAERALGAALPIIQKVAWISEQILDEPLRQNRREILDRATRNNSGLREPIEARVRRKWGTRTVNHESNLAAARAYLED